MESAAFFCYDVLPYHKPKKQWSQPTMDRNLWNYEPKLIFTLLN
jgi:hypothetical protein